MNSIEIGIIIFAYQCGSISNAILICKIASFPDPRTIGSGNPGATNMLRIGGKMAAIAVMILDVLKGMIPMWIGYAFKLSPSSLGIVAISTCLGHIYPVFFHFRGGKGVSTALGALLSIDYDLSFLLIGTWLLTVLISGYSSLGAIVSAIIAPLCVLLLNLQFIFPVSIISFLILIRHYDNIKRLWHGQENRIWINQKKNRDI